MQVRKSGMVKFLNFSLLMDFTQHLGGGWVLAQNSLDSLLMRIQDYFSHVHIHIFVNFSVSIRVQSDVDPRSGDLKKHL